MPTFDPHELAKADRYYLLTSLVVPRPIAWVGSRNAAGRHNLAPHSYFNVISADPAIVHFTSVGEKDTLANVRATGAFTVSIVSEDLLEAMNTTAADFPADIDEFAWAGLAKADGEVVDVPYVAAAPAALECRVRSILSMGDGNMVFGDVARVHVADRVWHEGRVDPEVLRPLGRLAGSSYVIPDTVRALKRPRWADLAGSGPQAAPDEASPSGGG